MKKRWKKNYKMLYHCSKILILIVNLMPILFCCISPVIVQEKFETFISKMWRKNSKVVHLRLIFTYLHQNLFNIKKHLALVLKNFCLRSFLCIPD